MNTVTIYKITTTLHAKNGPITSGWYSLESWAALGGDKNTIQGRISGGDDGGRKYFLPDELHVADSGEAHIDHGGTYPTILDEGGNECSIYELLTSEHQLCADNGEAFYVLAPVDEPELDNDKLIDGAAELYRAALEVAELWGDLYAHQQDEQEGDIWNRFCQALSAIDGIERGRNQ